LAFENDLMPVGETFSLAVGLAVRSALASEANTEASLKWPNDVEIEDRKIGGILVERDDQRTVVGCGLNLWWPSPPVGVTAVSATEPAAGLGLRLSQAWATAIVETKGSWDHATYRQACSTLGAELSWEPQGRGKAVDVDDRGGLVVVTAAGEVVLRSGEVQTVRRVSGDA
jgi:BirA family biotin operon repressor/biotin-[acetyl-CoA-carboxylase] ligase